MKFIIPPKQSKKHLQNNRGEFDGTIFKSRNISLDEEGYIKLAEGVYAEYTREDNNELGLADAMFPSASEIFVNGNTVFSGVMNMQGFFDRAGDTNAPGPGITDDVIYFNGQEIVSDGTSILRRSGSSTWTSISLSGSGFSGSNPTCMAVFGIQNSLAVGNSNVVKFVNTSWAVNATVLTLPPDFLVTSMTSTGALLFIATRSLSGGEARVFVLNTTIKTGHDNSYPVGSYEMSSIKTFKSTVVGINSLGQLLKFTGGGFEQLAQLPVYNSTVDWTSALNTYSTLSNRSIVVDGDLIYVILSSLTASDDLRFLPDFPSGVWCYDDSNGSFYHKYGASYSRVKIVAGTSVTVSAANDNFTLTSGNLNDVVTGMPLLYEIGNGTTIPELKPTTTYYVIKDSSTVFRIASTYTNALAGTAIDITGTGNTFQDWFIVKTNDYGWIDTQNRLALAVLNTNLYDTNFTGRLAMTSLLAGKQDVGSSKSAICGISPFLPNRGYFVTPKLESENIEDTWQRIYVKHKPLKIDEKIIVKYKTLDTANFPFSSHRGAVSAKWKATWSNTTTFTTTADLSGVSVGDEIEITAGVGSGHIAFITDISGTSTYTVTLGESFPFAVSGDQFYFNVDKWLLADEITSASPTNEAGFFESGISPTSTFIQIKIEMRGVGVAVSELQVISQTTKSSQVYN